MNVASLLPKLAQQHPKKVAVKAPRKNSRRPYQTITFRELEAYSNALCHYYQEQGLEPGDYILVFIKPSVYFSVITFSLFKMGLIPIFLDPGMGLKNLRGAIEHIKPTYMIAEDTVFLGKIVFPRTFRSIKKSFRVNSLVKKARVSQEVEPVMKEVLPHDPAAILFTSGGTGIPKGVLYTHHIFNTQRELLRKTFSLTGEDIDLPGFPLFGLFTICMGMTSIIPPMNPSKPAKASGENIAKSIINNQVTFAAGSPAIWKNVARYCLDNHLTLPSIKYLVMFGAPVSLEMHRMFQKILTNGDTYTPYGATECLPVANISGSELLEKMEDRMNHGEGTCVGKPLDGIQVSIISIDDMPIQSEDHMSLLATDQLGEITVSAPIVTPEYVGMEQKTKEAKVPPSRSHYLWHRMGDIGYIDEQGYLWFCGRKGHRFEHQGKTYGAVPFENVINDLEEVERCALIAPQKNNYTQLHLLVKKSNKNTSEKSLREMIAKQEAKKKLPFSVPQENIIFVDQFPVDGRHNIKIDRVKLKQQYEGRL